MPSSKPKPGRPAHVAQYVEGEEAAANFEKAIKKILSVPKEAVFEAEKQEKKRNLKP